MKAKRSLGQNFFVNHTLAEKIVGIVTESNPQLIIEIGPGTGSFTALLETKAKKLICIEKDDVFAKNLSIFYKTAEIINKDILDCDINAIIKSAGITNKDVIIFGSLPYNVSKPIVDKMLSTSQVTQQFYIIQKEVAQKYCAKAPDYNYLAVATQTIATPKMLLNISPESFRPRPKVNSTLIKFTLNDKTGSFTDLKEYNQFKDFIHKCFTKPNKTMKNNLGDVYVKRIPEKLTWILDKRPFALTKEVLLETFKTMHK